MRPVYIILIQIGIIIVFAWIGGVFEWYKPFKENMLFLEIILLVFYGICAIMCIILIVVYLILKKKMESNWWYIYHIYWIPLSIISLYSLVGTIGIGYKPILVFLSIMFFALIPVIILKGSKIKAFVFLTLISSALIIVPLAILWIKNAGFTLILSLLSLTFDVYLGFVYH